LAAFLVVAGEGASMVMGLNQSRGGDHFAMTPRYPDAFQFPGFLRRRASDLLSMSGTASSSMEHHGFEAMLFELAEFPIKVWAIRVAGHRGPGLHSNSTGRSKKRKWCFFAII